MSPLARAYWSRALRGSIDASTVLPNVNEKLDNKISQSIKMNEYRAYTPHLYFLPLSQQVRIMVLTGDRRRSVLRFVGGCLQCKQNDLTVRSNFPMQ